MKMNFLKGLKSPRFKHGSLAAVITIGFIVLVVLVNVIATLLLERFPLSIDLTTDNRFELTQESIDFTKKLEEKVTVSVCIPEQEMIAGGEYYKQAYEIMKSYPKYSSNVTLEFIDLVKDPNFAKQHPEEQFSRYDVLVHSDLRSKKTTVNDMFESSESQQTGQTTTRSKAEQIMTTAIEYVADKTPVTGVLLTGLNNVDATGYTELLKTNNYNIKEQSLLTEEIDPAAEFVILPQPGTDLTAEQATKLEKYLDNDAKFGKSLIFVASENREIEPVLKAFLADWGMEIGNDIIVETDPAHAYQNNAFFILNQIVNEDLAADANTTQPVVTVNARPITTLFEQKDNRETKVLVSSYDSATLYPVDATPEFDLAAQETGVFNTVVMGTRLKYDGTTPQTSKVICISSESLVASDLMAYQGFSNGTAALALTNQAAAKKESVKIVPITFSNDVITITSGQVWINRVLFMIIIPIIIVGAGLVIWLRRRHL